MLKTMRRTSRQIAIRESRIEPDAVLRLLTNYPEGISHTLSGPFSICIPPFGHLRKRKMLQGISRTLMLVIFVASTGCGGGGVDDYPDIGSVTGTITMDEKPLANATVAFVPADNSRMSIGATDEDGYYELMYSATIEGAKIGEHTVKISTRRPAGPGEDGEWEAGTPETVPNKFNSKSTLKKKVENGSNDFSFELTSDGEIDKHVDEKEEDN
jgi:hypothetical protein